jgi:hypothetical protein
MPCFWTDNLPFPRYWPLGLSFLYFQDNSIINPACRFGTPVIPWATERCWHGMHEVKGSNPCAHCSPDDVTCPLPTLIAQRVALD